MKLYTEEQIKKVLNPGLFYLIEPQLTPIELPSDEDIEKQPIKHTKAVDPPNVYYRTGFKAGAKWMKEQILGKKDKTFKQKSKWTEVDNMTRRLK